MFKTIHRLVYKYHLPILKCQNERNLTSDAISTLNAAYRKYQQMPSEQIVIINYGIIDLKLQQRKY